MALLSRVSNYLWSYVSPRKTQKKRDRPFKASPSASRTPLDAAARVEQWRQKHSRETSPTSASPDRVDGLDTTNDLQGDTLLDSIEQTPFSRSSTPGGDFDANETTLVMNEHDYANETLEHKEYFDAEAEAEARARLAEQLRTDGWSDHSVELFVKLEARGKEPLMPKAWQLDLTTLPDGLFSSDDKEVFIKSMSEEGDFRASVAVSELVQLGPRSRDAIHAQREKINSKKRAPENVTKKAIDQYMKWAYADAQLKVAAPSTRKSLDAAIKAGSSLPLVLIEAAPKETTGSELQELALRKLVALGEQWKVALRDPASSEYVTPLPTLYAVVLSFTVMGFVAYDIDYVDDHEPVDPFLRTIAIFDFSKEEYDVWNSLAVAIFGVHIRNEMVDIREAVKDYEGAEDGDLDPEDDPDA